MNNPSLTQKIHTLKVQDINARPSTAHEDFASDILNNLGIKSPRHIKEVMTYFVRYGYIPVSDKNVSEAAKMIGSAPWIGYEGNILEESINKLIQEKVLEFSALDEIQNQLVLHISTNTSNIEANQLLEALWQKTKDEIEKRRNIISLRGWKHSVINGVTNRESIRKIIEDAPTNSIVKIMTYHGRTWLSPGVVGLLTDIAGGRNDLHFKLLIVDKKAKSKVIEGATRQEHMRACAYGISNLKKMDLGRTLLSQFDVRTYGNSEKDSYLRCFIVQDREGKINNCIINDWFFGRERGFYGREIELDSDSSLALLVVTYFDSVFKKSFPQLGFIKIISWIIQLYWFEILTIIIIPTSSLLLIKFGTDLISTVGIAIGSILTGIAYLLSLKYNRNQ